MVWIILGVLYLLAGFYFKKPKEWSRRTKILAHIFWLPLALFIFVVVKKGWFSL